MDSRFEKILRRINTNISNSALLRIPILADKFGIAATYFPEYFKKQAGISLAEHVTKLISVEKKVLHPA